MELSPFLKQLFVAAAPILASLSVGGALAYPTVLLHQLKNNDTTIEIDFETASWIGAIHGFAGTPSIIMPTLMQWKGRKIAFITSCLIFSIGWILAYTANSASVILSSEFFHGFGSNSIYAVTSLTITEMIAPAYRDSLMQMYFVLEALAMTLNGVMTHYLHWKTISLILLAPMIPVLIIAFLWPESPYWLAHKGEFTKCEKAFTWLRGTDITSDKELKELINAKKEVMAANKKKEKKRFFKYYFEVIRRRDFYLPAAHIFVLQSLIHCSGALVILIYSIELFRDITGSEDIAYYGGFVLNGLQLIGILGCIFIGRFLNKKTILLSSACGVIVTLTCASITSYLQRIGVLPRDSIVSLIFLASYSLVSSFGIMSQAAPFASSLMPVKYRDIGGIFYIISNTSVLFTLALKTFPYLVYYIGVSGTFLVYAFNTLIASFVIWKYVPEIKGRTLQEIEDFYSYGRFLDKPREDTFDELGMNLNVN